MADRDLIKESEAKYPYPIKMCAYVKAKIDWLRERWVRDQSHNQNLLRSKNNTSFEVDERI